MKMPYSILIFLGGSSSIELPFTVMLARAEDAGSAMVQNDVHTVTMNTTMRILPNGRLSSSWYTVEAIPDSCTAAHTSNVPVD